MRGMQKRVKQRPDLKLAETYLPAAICVSKCMCIYCFVGPVLAFFTHAGVRLCVVTAILLCLYYDHLYPSSVGQQRFVDTNALCVDVVAGTLLAYMLQLDALGLHATLAVANATTCVLWAIGGAAHVYLGKDRLLSAPATHGLTSAAIMLVTLATANACHFTACITAQHAGYAFGAHVRGALYLALCLVDSYALKPVWQRESERLHVLRYGSVLLVHCTYGLPVCVLALGASQVAKLVTIAPMCDMLEQGLTNSSSSTVSSMGSMTAADAEAFQIAREQYLLANKARS